MREERPSVIAQPLDEHEWQVIAGDWHREGGGRVLGFIEELGGTYEVEIVDQPALCQFFDTFKEAVDCFALLEQVRGRDPVREGGIAC